MGAALYIMDRPTLSLVDAAHAGDLDTVKHLIERGADVHMHNEAPGTT